MKNVPFINLIGLLMYLSVATRPDITYDVNFSSQFNNPGKEHWHAAKRIIRYLKGTQDQGLIYTKTGKPLIAFVDADWTSNVNDRKSYTGFVYILSGSAITWESRKQRSVALSSTEAEYSYMALSEAAKETVYLRRFLKELSYNIEHPTTIYCDNQGAQKITKNSVFHSRTKHIDIRHHFVREVYERGELDVQYIPTGS
ncbi:secreted RxLR effector protein 161-like [Stegodyphus dumicola]|uniref:secreted RxLR effector protein 161-like n=1 Tax=Stegodyphus dumicola TaxID=202533 RepID=UPI0015AE4863|nr:secreted RxLR effector protein 161-like [Stegodyphus dumicola]